MERRNVIAAGDVRVHAQALQILRNG